MDPLSITASAIAIGGLLKGLLKTASAVKELQKLDDSVLILLNELSDLSLVVQDVANVFGQLEEKIAPVDGEGKRKAASFDLPTASLAQFLNRTKGILEELKQLVEYDLLTPDSRPGHLKVSRTAWLRKKGHIQALKDRLRDARSNIVANLGVLGCVTGYVVQIELREIRAELQGGNGVKEGINRNEANGMEIGKVNPKVPHLAPCQHELQPQPPTIPAYGSTPYHAFEVRMVRGSNIKCDVRCTCRCHRSTQFRSPQALQQLIGSLFLGYSNVPLLNRGCNDRFCKRQSIALSAVYRFPKWLCQRQLRLFADAPEFLLRVTQVRPNKSSIFTYARKNYVPGLKRLLSTGEASVLDVDELGRNALFIAVYSSAMDAVRLLLQQSSDARQTTRTGWSALHEAWLCILICPNTPFKPYFTDRSDIEIFGFSKLHQAVLQLNEQNVETALEYWQDRDIDVRDDQGNTPLAWAVRRNDQKAIRLLLDRGADPNLKVNGNLTPLAISLNHCEAFQHFAHPALDLSFRSQSGDTMLHVVLWKRNSRYRGCVMCIENLIAKGVGVNQQNNAGLTPFHVACSGASTAAVELLIKHGADIEQRTNKGITPLLLAVEMRNYEVVDFLLGHGVDTHALSAAGSTVLHFAAAFGDRKLFDTLVKWHLPAYFLQWRNSYGHTPLAIQLKRSKRPWFRVFLDLNVSWTQGPNAKAPSLKCHRQNWINGWENLVASLAAGPEPDPEVVKKDMQIQSTKQPLGKGSKIVKVLNSPAWMYVRAASLDAIPLLNPSSRSLASALLLLAAIWLVGCLRLKGQRQDGTR